MKWTRTVCFLGVDSIYSMSLAYIMTEFQLSLYINICTYYFAYSILWHWEKPWIIWPHILFTLSIKAPILATTTSAWAAIPWWHVLHPMVERQAFPQTLSFYTHRSPMSIKFWARPLVHENPQSLGETQGWHHWPHPASLPLPCALFFHLSVLLYYVPKTCPSAKSIILLVAKWLLYTHRPVRIIFLC